MIKDAVENYCRNHSFLSYIISEIWFIYAKEFKDKSQPDHSLNNLRLAALLTNAARVSMLTDSPCSCTEWDNILSEAETSEDPFVKVAFALYKIAIFEDSWKNSVRLYENMRKFKREYPQYYKLIGFNPGEDGAPIQ